MCYLRRRLWQTLFAFVSILYLAAPGAAERSSGAPGSLWIAGGEGALTIATRHGESRLRVASEEAVLAAAADVEGGRVWLYTASSLAAYRLDGTLEARFELDLPKAAGASLAVVPEDGSVWLARGRLLLAIGPSGQELHRIELPAAVEQLSLDRERSLLWVAAAGRMTAYDAIGGFEVRTAAAASSAADMAVDPVSGGLWTVLGDGLHRLAADGSTAVSATVEGLSAVAADDRGGVWAAAGAELLELGAEGDLIATYLPLGEDVELERLVFDPSHRAVWAIGGGRAAKVSAGGEVLALIELGDGFELPVTALYPGPADQDPPSLSFRPIYEPHGFDPTRRVVFLRYGDPGSGVESESLRVRILDVDEDLECRARVASARCWVPTSRFTEDFTLVATVADHMGNLAEARLRLASTREAKDGEVDDEEAGNGEDAGDRERIDNVSAATDGSLAGQLIPSLRGILPEQTFLSDGNVESINTANGNLTLSVPLGQVYRVGPHIKYQLRATHNSDAWDHATVTCAHTNSGCQTTFGPVLVSLPQRTSNAGAGWEVHFGKLFAPQAPTGANTLDTQTWPNRDASIVDIGNRWLYVSPDGASHHLYVLNGRTNTQKGFPVRYAKDGSFIRMRQVNATTVLVDHPNGVVSEFESTGSDLGTTFCGNGITGCWRFKEQRDYYGNRVWVTYGQSGSVETWTISDSTNRVQRIHFRRDNAARAGGDANTKALQMPNGDQLGDLRRLVDRVEVASAGGGVATYQFRYSIQDIPRARPHDPLGSLSAGNERIRVPLLTTIEVPDSADYKLTHFTDFTRSARVATIQFPTQGKYSYSYGNWYFPTPCVYTSDPTVEFQYSRYGITQKRHLRPDGTEIALWTYSNQLFPAIPGPNISGPNCKRADYRRTEIRTPTIGGRYTLQRNFHAVTIGPKNPVSSDPIGGWQISDHGLPLRKDVKIGSGNSDYIFLSEQTFDCNPSCVKKREKYVRYAMEWRGCSTHLLDKDPGTCFQVNPVMVRQRTIFNDDGGKYVEIKGTQHDGAGHRRRTYTLDNFNGSIRQVEHRTGYTATGSTILSENANTGYINRGTPSSYLPGPSQSWILTPYDNKLRIDGGLTYRTDYQFDAKGSVTCIRKRKFSGSYNPRDLVTKYTLGGTVGTNAGLPVTEILAGGENGALASGVCNAAGSEGVNKFTFSHGYAFLTRSSTQIGSFPYRYRADIDRNTGLPSAVYNPSDQKTSMFYDRLGRIKRVAPAGSLGEAETLVTYTNNVGSEPNVKIERKFGGSRYAFEQVTYDYFGRPRREFQSLPTGLNSSANSERVTVYDAAGRITAVSTVQQASNVNTVQKTTRYFGLDAFGRPSLILRADGGEERWTYKGERETQSTRLIRTSQTGSQNVTTTTVYDGLGREVSVANPEHTLVSFYDPNGKVVRVERRKGAFNQKREYGWDNRGLLAFEKHPEVGSSSSLGTLSFQPDALGNPRQTFEGLNTLTHEYDGDGRLIRVKQGSKVWEEYSWANANSGADYRKGKIIQATRHNYPGAGTFSWAIVESYQYRGKLGKKSHRTTQLQWPSNPGTDRYAHTFTQTWTYDVLGDLVSQTYPTCITTPENGRQYCNDPSDSLPPAHTVTRTMNQRLPVRISSNLGISADYRYHWNFQLKRIDYSNGAYTDLTQGTNGMQRPASITHRQPNGATLFATGTYSYDAAGNIWAIGADNYVYDRASRLTRGTVRTSTRWEAYTYDAADNLRTVTRDGSLASDYNIDVNKNRMVGTIGQPADIFYDAAGNLTQVGTASPPAFDLDYDVFNMEVRFARTTPQQELLYAYGPGNFRIISFDVTTGTFYWSLRDLDGKLLREHRVTGGGHYQGPTQPGEIWTFEKDHVHGPTGLLATRDAAGVRQFFHQDHLGTPRAISSAAGTLAGTRNYYPYGVPASGSGADERASKFAGHELDRHAATYYMLARTYAYPWMRFASVDPGRSGWNYYSYADSNPINRVDPDGEAAQVVAGAVVGGIVGGLIDLGLQLYEGEGVDGRQLLGAVVSGGIVGGTAALTGGASLIVDVGGVALASTGGGIVGRAIAGDSTEEIFDDTAILTDLTLGGASRGAARFARGKVENVVRSSPDQRVRLRQADSRARAAQGRSPSRQAGPQQKLKEAQTRPERMGGRTADVTENAVTVFFRDTFTAVSNFFTGD